MKQFFTLLFATVTIASVNSQTLLADDFNSYTLGNLGTQGGWGRDGGDVSQAKVAEVTPATYGKSLQFLRTTTTSMWMYKALPWSTRQSGNNILHLKFDLHTGSGAGAVAAQVYADGASYYNVGTLAYSTTTNAFTWYNDDSTTEENLGTGTPNTWYTVNLYYDSTTGSSTIFINGTSYGPFTGTPGKNPDEFDIFSGSGIFTASVDNVQIAAVNQILATSEVSKTSTSVVYPNPSSDIVNVKSASKVRNISLFDQSGRKVMETRETAVNIESLSKGVYLMEIHYQDGSSETKKIIKE